MALILGLEIALVLPNVSRAVMEDVMSELNISVATYVNGVPEAYVLALLAVMLFFLPIELQFMPVL